MCINTNGTFLHAQRWSDQAPHLEIAWSCPAKILKSRFCTPELVNSASVHQKLPKIACLTPPPKKKKKKKEKKGHLERSEKNSEEN